MLAGEHTELQPTSLTTTNGASMEPLGENENRKALWSLPSTNSDAFPVAYRALKGCSWMS